MDLQENTVCWWSGESLLWRYEGGTIVAHLATNGEMTGAPGVLTRSSQRGDFAGNP